MGLKPTSNEATGQSRRNPECGRSFSPRLRCSLLTDPLRDMLVAHASSGRKIPRRERHRIYDSDHSALRHLRAGGFEDFAFAFGQALDTVCGYFVEYRIHFAADEFGRRK